jgi:alpha-tubulin suppressor-like RCC1 family protein
VAKNKFLCGSITIRNFIEDYLFRSAYPILQIEPTPVRVHFDQRSSDGSDLKWNIPIFVRNLATSENELLWLRKDGSLCNNGTNRFRPDLNSTYSYNTKGRAFIRVEYLGDGWSKLIEKAAIIDPTTQYTILMGLLSGKVAR